MKRVIMPIYNVTLVMLDDIGKQCEYISGYSSLSHLSMIKMQREQNEFLSGIMTEKLNNIDEVE